MICPAPTVPLDMLRSGEAGQVTEILGDVGSVNRIEEMGLRRGTIIRVLQSGSPLILAHGNHRLCFRPEPSTTVLVDLIPGEPAPMRDSSPSTFA
ncbi:FeoA family protein [Stratiformator vulcanicus]|uniref:FeoA domain protein n=1 Tax=Stratiformator vulcanicus TaxID=2527980 RepID=A0A517QW42_9PLAN|nr:FeoA domain-containing protein [Stratiformator vulcanicus]QDT35793.1 FeoA domain protein [Stratiformator vulcanicus]